MNYEFFANSIDLSFSLIKENRKTLSARILSDGSLIVKSPLFVSLEEVKLFITKHMRWIVKKKEGARQLNTGASEEYTHNSILLFMGNKYQLVIQQGLLDKVFIEDGKMMFYATRPKNQKHIKKVLDGWYLKQAHEVFDESLLRCLDNFSGLQMPDLVIRNMKRRWGSYSSSHKITLTLSLIKAPERCIDYVVIHELCHAYHMNHGKEFKKLLSLKILNWKEIKKELNSYVISC